MKPRLRFLRDPARGVLTLIERCKKCDKSVYRSLNEKNHSALFEADDDGEPTRKQHVKCAGATAELCATAGCGNKHETHDPYCLRCQLSGAAPVVRTIK